MKLLVQLDLITFLLLMLLMYVSGCNCVVSVWSMEAWHVKLIFIHFIIYLHTVLLI